MPIAIEITNVNTISKNIIKNPTIIMIIWFLIMGIVILRAFNVSIIFHFNKFSFILMD